MTKKLRFHGDANDRLRELPVGIRSHLGYQLYLVQQGLEPTDWRGVREVRVRDDSGAYRAIYLATLPDAVHVYHTFQKRTQKTSKRDLEIAKSRHQEHMRNLK
jgi:phage-related protein